MLIAANKSQPINVWCIPFYLCKTSQAKQNFSFVRRVPWDSNLMQLLLFFKQKKHWNSTDQSQDKISIANESVLLNRQERYECVRVCMCCNKFMWISTLIDSSQSITASQGETNIKILVFRFYRCSISSFCIHSFIPHYFQHSINIDWECIAAVHGHKCTKRELTVLQ